MSSESGESVTDLLHRAQQGDAEATDRLFETVYGELRRVAEGLMHRERGDHTLQPTALVNEAAARLIQPSAMDQIGNRSQFFAAMGRAMRRVLVDHARLRLRKKRGGDQAKIPLDETLAFVEDQLQAELLSLEEALAELEAMQPRQGRVVELKFFAGLPMDEIARMLEVSVRTVQGDWMIARAWLRRRLHEND